MTLTFEEFKKHAAKFIAVSSSLGDEWVAKSFESAQVKEMYLEKRILKPGIRSKDNVQANSNEIEHKSSFNIFVYHIVYSDSYSVPVLCFNANHEDGKLLTLEEIWSQIPECYIKGDEDKWNMLTQQEHPKLGIPCFMIHPCYTADLINSYQTSNYIISWLSIVGPLVGLNLSLEYAKFT